jgi:hypothetical protein
MCTRKNHFWLYALVYALWLALQQCVSVSNIKFLFPLSKCQSQWGAQNLQKPTGNWCPKLKEAFRLLMPYRPPRRTSISAILYCYAEMSPGGRDKRRCLRLRRMCFIPTNLKEKKNPLKSKVTEIKLTKINTLFCILCVFQGPHWNVNLMTDHQV